jgi:uncharacterized membrane protein YfcA
MGALLAAGILAAVFLTCLVSGVFGMAGGLMLMGALAFVLPITQALALHGVVQLSSNAWRMILHRRHIAWRTLGVFAIGAVAAMGLFALVAFTPTKGFVYLALGLLPILVWLPERWFNLDAARPSHAVAAGLVSTLLSLTAGVSGPVTDLFFVRTTLTRHQVVATKAPMQAFGHVSKIVAYGGALLSVEGRQAVPLWVLGAAIVLSMIGIVAGGRILDAMSDDHFRAWRRWIVTAMGGLYLAQAAALFWPR